MAERVKDIFYSSENPAAGNLCAFHEGLLGQSAYIECISIMHGKFVQAQNNILQDVKFHLSEVEVFGF